MALSKTTRILALFILGLSVACVALLVALVIRTNSSDSGMHSLIRGILTQSCSAGAKNFTNCVFYHVQFSGVIQNIAYHCAIFTLSVYIDYYQNNQFYIVKISFSKFCYYGRVICNILDNNTE